MTNPVMQALVSARLSQLNKSEAHIAEQVDATLGPAPRDTHRPQRFIRWAEAQALPWRPATPSAVAAFVLEHTKLDVEELRLISLAHSIIGLPDPCGAWQVVAAISRLTKTRHLPRSWPREFQLQWDVLPEDIKQIIQTREEQRDRAVSRAQNEAADLRKKLANYSKPKEITNGDIVETETRADA
jgi:hypothetical protein